MLPWFDISPSCNRVVFILYISSCMYTFMVLLENPFEIVLTDDTDICIIY